MASYLSYRNVLLSNSTVIASTLNAGSVSYSTLTGSTMSSRALNVSTLSGSTINISTLTGSTIQGTTVFFSTMTASTILTAGSTISLARNVNVPNRFVEVGCDLADSMYLDFHSKDSALPDYSTRIISQGGTTTGTGNLNMYASTIGLMVAAGVGIGTTAPNAALHISTAPTANGIINVNSNTTLSSTAGSQDILQRWVETTSNTSIIDLSYVRIATGSDWSTTGQRFQSKIDATWQAFMQFNLYGIQFGAGGSTVSANSIPTVMSIIQSGNVGIGVTNPTYNFQVGTALTSDLGGGLRTQFSSGLTNVTAASVRNGNDWLSQGTFGGSGPYTFTTNAASAAYFTIATGIRGYGTVYQFSITASGPAGSSFSVSANGGPGIPLTNLTTSLTVYTGTLITNQNGIYVFVNGASGTVFTFSAISVTRMDTVVNGYLGVGGMASPPLAPLDVHTPATGRQTVLRLNCTVSTYGDSAQGPRLEFYTRNYGNEAYYFQSAIQSIADNSSAGSGSGGLAFITINDTVQRESMRISSVGNVGIGAVAPATLLHIAKSVSTNSDYSLMLYYENTYPAYQDWAIGPYIDNNAAAFAVRGGSNNAPASLVNMFYIDGTGTAIRFPQYQSTGTLTISGGLISVSSDRRIKRDIVYQTDTADALARVLQLRPATFRFLEQDSTHLGFIAQDVEQHIPLAVDGKKYEWQWIPTENGAPTFDAEGNIMYRMDKDGNRIVRPRGLDDRAIIAEQTLASQELAKQATSSASQIQELARQTAQLTTSQSAISQTVQELATENAQLKSQLAALEARLTAAGL